MKKLPSRALFALLVLATLPSVNCSILFTTTELLDVSEYRGCYEEANDELSVVLSLGLPEDINNNNSESNTTESKQLLGCLTFAKSGQPFVGPFPLFGDSKKNNTAKMTATVPTGDKIKVVLTRDVKTINFEEVVSISIDFPGEPAMKDIRRRSPEYVLDTMCPTRCPLEDTP